MNTAKSSHKAPFTLRLRPELRTELEREAAINRRPLAQEIMLRLEESMARGRAAPGTSVPPMAGTGTATCAASITDAHRMLIASYDALTPDQQLALLTFLRR